MSGSKHLHRLWVIGLIGVVAACSPSKPRTEDDIFADRMNLPRLYMTYPDGRQIKAAEGPGAWVEEATGDVFLPAFACGAPDCPGRDADGTPHLFVFPRPHMLTNSSDVTSMPKGDGGCPECAKMSGLAADERRLRIIKYVKPHMLPETAERVQELDKERRLMAERSRSN